MAETKRIGIVVGTRPEAIKMAPVIYELGARVGTLEPIIISTAQHRQMLDQVFRVFQISPDHDLNVMQPNQTLSATVQRILGAMETLLPSLGLDCLLVQGDTTTAFAAALAAFYQKIPVAHVEAGLRSRDLRNPFPEEANRRLAGVVTDLNFAPTQLARTNLRKECVSPEKIVVTGNTVVDAVRLLVEMNALDAPLPPGIPESGRMILVTSHRRESWGRELENICGALRDLTEAYSDVHIVYPVHMNPNVRRTVDETLRGIKRVHLTEPLDYFSFLTLLRRCHLVLTDSGGVQEEAPFFRKPVLVLRKVTERPEASMLGLARVIGTSRESIFSEASGLLSDDAAYTAMTSEHNPYGDGFASRRIADALARWLDGVQPPLDPWEEFQSLAELEPASPGIGSLSHTS